MSLRNLVSLIPPQKPKKVQFRKDKTQVLEDVLWRYKDQFQHRIMWISLILNRELKHFNSLEDISILNSCQQLENSLIFTWISIFKAETRLLGYHYQICSISTKSLVVTAYRFLTQAMHLSNGLCLYSMWLIILRTSVSFSIQIF